MCGPQIVHFAGYFNSLGGMQSVLKRHRAYDQAHHVPSEVVVFFEPAGSTSPPIHALGLTGFHSIREVRRRLGRLRAQRHGGTVIYHDCWGLPFLADLDGAARRIGYLHNNPPDFGKMLSHQRDLLDGVICISRHQIAAVDEALPELGPHRVTFLPLPIPSTPLQIIRPPMAGRPIVVGFSGRLVRVQKRVDRLVALFAALKQAGLPFRLEILGDGPMRCWLEQRLGADAAVVFHQTQTGDRYWQILNSWDFIVFVSDWEGLPNALLEALQCGVLPLYPKIQTGGDAYAAQVLPDLLYEPEDFRQSASVIQQIRRLPEPDVETLRERCRRAVHPHQADNYFSAFYQFVRLIGEAPRISRHQFSPGRAYFTDFGLLGILSRIYPSALLKQTPA